MHYSKRRGKEFVKFFLNTHQKDTETFNFFMISSHRNNISKCWIWFQGNEIYKTNFPFTGFVQIHNCYKRYDAYLKNVHTLLQCFSFLIRCFPRRCWNATVTRYPVSFADNSSLLSKCFYPTTIADIWQLVMWFCIWWYNHRLWHIVRVRICHEKYNIWILGHTNKQWQPFWNFP